MPVFNDKHLGPTWTDAKWMYDRARELKIPFMAGSSLPLSFRSPEIDVPLGSEIEAAVGIGYSGPGHLRQPRPGLLSKPGRASARGREGVKSVRVLSGAEVWNAVSSGVVSGEFVDAALAVVPKVEGKNPRPERGSLLVPLRVRRWLSRRFSSCSTPFYAPRSP